MNTLMRDMFVNNQQRLPLISVLVIASVLAGCGEKANSSQVAAKVNSDEITISQVNSALESMPVMPGKTLEQAKQEVLDNLIVQKLAGQEAIKSKLDRTPAVMQAIDNAKNTILARAYMDPIVGAVSKPTPDDVHKFYVGHPELFSERRIYNLRELEADNKPDLAASLRDQIGKGNNLDQIADWLKGKDITSNIQSGVKSAEQLPQEIVARLSKLSAGQMMVIEQAKSISVIQIKSSKVEPVEEAAANVAIQQYLYNDSRKTALDKEIKLLRSTAKIEYVGEFDGKKASSVVPVKATVPAGAEDLAKGVAGLK